MAKFLIVAIVALTIVGTLAAPEKGKHDKKAHGDHKGHWKKLDLTSCMTPKALEDMKQEFKDCKTKMAAFTTTSTEASQATEDKHKQHNKWGGHNKMAMMCMMKKSKVFMTSLDTLTKYAQENMTTEAQTPFVDTIKSCLTEKNVDLANLHKPEAKMEDWKPAMCCMKQAMNKACKEMTSTTESSDSNTSMEMEVEDENN